MDPDDDLERLDDAIGASLRRRADELSGRLDGSVSWAVVERQARRRRRWRLAAASVGAAAAAAVAMVGFSSFTGGEREVLRAPTTQPPVGSVGATSSRSTTTTTEPATPGSTAPVVPPPTGSAALTTSTSAEPTAPAASTTAYSSEGGAITVRLTGGTIALDGDPEPADGWTVRIDDDGPDRVRVRFERDDERSEIRVDLTADGRLEPRITDR